MIVIICVASLCMFYNYLFLPKLPQKDQETTDIEKCLDTGLYATRDNTFEDENTLLVPKLASSGCSSDFPVTRETPDQL